MSSEPTPPGVTPLWNYARIHWKIKDKPWLTEFISEFIGTAILCLFVVGSSIQYVIFNETYKGTNPDVQYRQPEMNAIIGQIFGIMTAILITGGSSGAHINCAVTVGLAIVGQMNWKHVPLYFVAQIFGGYVGSLMAYYLYEAKLLSFGEGNDISTILPVPNYFSPVPDTFIGVGIADQIVGTGVLMMAILAVTDPRNMQLPKSMVAVTICLVVGSIAISFNSLAGAVLNPARDLCPRLAAMTVGYSAKAAMKNVNLDGDDQHWWIVGIIGPFIGASLGAVLYVLAIGAHLEEVSNNKIEKPKESNNNYSNNMISNDLEGGNFPEKERPLSGESYDENYYRNNKRGRGKKSDIYAIEQNGQNGITNNGFELGEDALKL